MARRRRNAPSRRGAVLAGALVVALAAPIATSTAEESLPETGEIRNGTAKAVAMATRIGPGVGDLELAMRGGLAITQVTNDLAQATSQTLELGLIGASLTAENCRGDQPLKPDDLPQPTFVDNRDGDRIAARDESGTEDAPFGFGRMHVEATEQPVAARAVTSANGIDLSPGLRLTNGRATSETEVLPGEGRQARAEVVSSLDVGGVVSLEGMRWRAYHRTGRDPLAEGAFEPGRATIGGLPFPSDDVGAVEDAANRLLEPLGASIELPRTERFLEPNDLVRVTPLRLTIRDSPAGQTVFGPLFDATREGRSDLFDALTSALCDLAAVLLVGDIVLSVIAGTGFLTIDIGGVEASSSDFELHDPFGDPIVPPVADLPILDDVAAGPKPSTETVSARPTPSAPATGSTEEALPASSRSGPLERVCESVHPNADSCSEGAAVLLGLLALLGTVGVAGADVVRERRARSRGDS